MNYLERLRQISKEYWQPEDVRAAVAEAIKALELTDSRSAADVARDHATKELARLAARSVWTVRESNQVTAVFEIEDEAAWFRQYVDELSGRLGSVVRWELPAGDIKKDLTESIEKAKSECGLTLPDSHC